MRIRPMTDADVPVLQRIHATATMSSYGAVLPWLQPILEDPATLLEPADWSLCAVDESDDRTVLGYVAVTQQHIENLYIEPSAQGSGIGARLLAAVEARVVERPLTLRCLVHNPNARRFYERHGFAVVDQQTISYHGAQLAAWLMAKP
jgi:ribosomal protein S18 acetylase RimI-like enzyme